MASNRDKVIVLVIVAAGIFILAGFSLFMYVITKTTPTELPFASLGGRVALIEITGVIESSEDVVRQLKKYEEDNSIKAVVMRIDSPGGGVAPSQEIYDQLLKFRENDKFVVVSMAGVAASGGYYIACAADTIFANPGTITGSIGVIFSFLVFENLMDKAGIKMEVVKSGDLKDVGNPARQLDPKERAMLQSVIDDTYDQFINVVAERRGLDIDLVKSLADGSIFTGRQAQEKGMVDKIGTLDDAIALAGEMAGLGHEPRVIKERPFKRSIFEQIVGLFGLDILKSQIRNWPALEYRYN
jgi:protease-4